MDEGAPLPAVIALAMSGGFQGDPEDLAIVVSALGTENAEPALAMSRAATPAAASGKDALLLLGLPPSLDVATAVWHVPYPRGFALVLFSLDHAMRIAPDRLDDPGFPFPEEVVLRLSAADARPGMARHFKRTASDALASHVLGLAAGLPGAIALSEDSVLWAGTFSAGQAAEALAWLAEPGPGAYAAVIAAAIPENLA